MIFADGLLDFSLSEYVLHIIRIIASVVGAIAAWFVCDPLTRLLYRISFRGATPGAILFTSKSIGAVTTSLLVYFFLPLGGGGGGLGWGPGLGGGPGKGPGPGGEKTAPVKNGKPATKGDPKSPETLESIEIEIISVNKFIDDGTDRFFLMKRAEPALSLTELEDNFKKNQAKIEVTPILTRDSIGITQEDNPLSQLLKLTKKYNIKTLQTKGPPTN